MRNDPYMPRVRPIFWICMASAALAAQAESPRELQILVSVKQKMTQNLQQVPNYTCLETIERARRMPRSLVISRDGGPGPFQFQDVARVEVAQVGREELFARPGARQFEEKRLSALVSGGLIGNGIFALLAHDIFVNRVATYQYAGKENVEGRELIRYDYQIPYFSSGYRIVTEGGSSK